MNDESQWNQRLAIKSWCHSWISVSHDIFCWCFYINFMTWASLHFLLLSPSHMTTILRDLPSGLRLRRVNMSAHSEDKGDLGDGKQNDWVWVRENCFSVCRCRRLLTRLCFFLNMPENLFPYAGIQVGTNDGSFTAQAKQLLQWMIFIDRKAPKSFSHLLAVNFSARPR